MLLYNFGNKGAVLNLKKKKKKDIHNVFCNLNNLGTLSQILQEL